MNFYNTVQNNTQLTNLSQTIHDFTQLYKHYKNTIHNATILKHHMQHYTQLYTTCTNLHTTLQSSTQLYNFTNLHEICTQLLQKLYKTLQNLTEPYTSIYIFTQLVQTIHNLITIHNTLNKRKQNCSKLLQTNYKTWSNKTLYKQLEKLYTTEQIYKKPILQRQYRFFTQLYNNIHNFQNWTAKTNKKTNLYASCTKPYKTLQNITKKTF